MISLHLKDYDLVDWRVSPVGLVEANRLLRSDQGEGQVSGNCSGLSDLGQPGSSRGRASVLQT